MRHARTHKLQMIGFTVYSYTVAIPLRDIVIKFLYTAKGIKIYVQMQMQRSNKSFVKSLFKFQKYYFFLIYAPFQYFTHAIYGLAYVQLKGIKL